MVQKAGLDSAVDTTKLVVTLDGGLIAFVTGATFLGNITSLSEKWSVVAALIFLSISLFGGMLVLLQAGTMYSNKTYALSSSWIRIPGLANLLGFALGAVAVGAMAVLTLVFRPPAPPSPLIQWRIHCTASASAEVIDCSSVPSTITPQRKISVNYQTS